MVDKTNRLNIYLMKDDPNITQYVDDDIPFVSLTDGSQFYGKNSNIRVPDWVSDFFGSELNGKFDFQTTSSRGLLIKTTTWNGHTRTFAITFGSGRYFLADGVSEERFGMKVVLNSVEHDVRP